jgi:RNA binding activity-knot of a chromodomain
MRTSRWAWVAILLVWGCRRAHQVGDHVLVAWRGSDYPAVIVGVEGPSKFHVHYDGFSEDWDEIIPATRIRARLSAAPSPAPPGSPPAKIRSKTAASGSAAPAPPSVYRLGDRVRVEWHGSIYTATIVTVLGDDRYRVHYEGYGSEWDEDINLSRIQRKGN